MSYGFEIAKNGGVVVGDGESFVAAFTDVDGFADWLRDQVDDVLSVAPYPDFLLEPKADADGWIPHTTNTNPTAAPWEKVDVRLNNGAVLLSKWSSDLSWDRTLNFSGMITHYRLAART